MTIELTGDMLSCDQSTPDESPTWEEALASVGAPQLFRNTPTCDCSASKVLSEYNITQLTRVHDFLFTLLEASVDYNPYKYIDYSKQGLEYYLTEEKIKGLAQRCHGIFHELTSKNNFRDSRLRNIYFRALSTLKTDQIEPFQSEILEPLVNATRLKALNTHHIEYLDRMIFGFWKTLPNDNLKFLINFFLIYCVHSPEKMNAIFSIFNLTFNPNTASLLEQKKRFDQLTSQLQKDDLAHLAFRIMKIIQAKIDHESFDPSPPRVDTHFTTPQIESILNAIPEGKMPFFMKFIALKLTQSPWRYRRIVETIKERATNLQKIVEGNVRSPREYNIHAEILSILTCDWH